MQGVCCSPAECPAGGAVQQRAVGGADLRERGAQRRRADPHHHRKTHSIQQVG